MSARRDVESAPATPEPAVGFHAQLEGASLWDLVQMECLARSRLVVEVTGEGGVGYLYFDAGRIVHATTARHRGEAAAFEILGWTHGRFQASNRSWPTAVPTIEKSSESLLLHAAQRRDEQGASNLVAFPTRGMDAAAESETAAALDDVELFEIDEEGEAEMRSPNIEDTPVPPATPRGESSADFPIMLRLSAQGAVLRNKGGSEELAEATAYAHRLVQLTGELLGLEEFVALECTFKDDHLLLFTEGDGDVVALRPRPEVNLQALRTRLGL
jgi:hypothetical protein